MMKGCLMLRMDPFMVDHLWSGMFGNVKCCSRLLSNFPMVKWCRIPYSHMIQNYKYIRTKPLFSHFILNMVSEPKNWKKIEGLKI
jgi:hypothetical protein